jgi:soluble lytic murein transglycosylase-like protein
MRGLRAILPARAVRSALAAASVLVAVLVPALAAGGVEVRPGASGRKVITNENEVQRARRLAPYLVAPAADDLLPLIERQAMSRGLDPRLVRAVVQVESGYNPAAVSNKGAMGLMQLMPATALDLDVTSPFEPEENLRGGTEYLSDLIDRFGGDPTLALAAYNAGPGAVARYGGVPPYPETVSYVENVLSLWRGEAGPAVEPAASPASGRPSAPARPVVWRTGGARAHLTNVDR